MISAFGVDHGISKSMISPGVFKPAKLLSGAERVATRQRSVERTGQFKSWGKPPEMAQRGLSSAKGRKVPGGVGTSSKINVVHSDKVIEHPTVKGKFKGGSAVINGRGGGTITMHPHPHADPAKLLNHELAHVAPKRNPVRWQQRKADPTRLGREEGRADYVAHGKPTPGAYPGPEGFQSGYNEVQGKMHAARQRRS